jgi:hypothetical protein
MKTKFSATATHATSASATQAAPGTGKRLIVTGFLASSDKAGSIMTLIEDAAGTPVTKLQLQIGASFIAHKLATPIVITANKTATINIDGTSACKANIVGVITNN